MTPDGKFLLVAHHLGNGRADSPENAATVGVIDLAAGKVVESIALPIGSNLLREIRISPDGKEAAVVHNLARFQMPTTQLDRGWMNTSALTLIDLATRKRINTVLLDSVDRGAANPWALAWTPDDKRLCVTHAGTQELSVIEYPALLAKLAAVPETLPAGASFDPNATTHVQADVPNDLSFLVGLRERIKLKGNGPRSLAIVGNTAVIADYFTDTLEAVEVVSTPKLVASVPLHEDRPWTAERRGEMHFNDAALSFQGWQSCATCHSQDARVDGLNWDLLNDGIGNPKNTKSLLLSHRTPPAMSMGVRETAETAVRAGIRSILFTVQPEEVPADIDAWLKSLRPMPSPHLVDGQLSPAAKRGEQLFHSEAVGCAQCHKPELFTDQIHHDVGTRGAYDKPADLFDTPTLIETWRTAPYLHDGSAPTMRDVLTTHNAGDHHGHTSQLTKEQVDDLVEYLLSL